MESRQPAMKRSSFRQGTITDTNGRLSESIGGLRLLRRCGCHRLRGAPKHAPVHVDELRRNEALVEVLHRNPASDELPACKHPTERRRDRFRLVVGADFASVDASQANGYVSNRDRDDGEMAG